MVLELARKKIYILPNGWGILNTENIKETHKHKIEDILYETLQHEKKAIDTYYQLLDLVKDKSVYLEEFARSMIGQEELHVLEVEKMLKEQ